MKRFTSFISKIFRINTINKKFSYSVISLFVFIILITSLVDLQLKVSEGDKELSSKGTTIASLASLSLSDAIWNFNQEGIKSGGEALFNDKEVYSVIVLDKDNKELYKKDRADTNMKKAGLVSIKNNILKEGNIIGVIEIDITKHYLNQKIGAALVQSIVQGVITIFLLFIIITLVSRVVIKPLKELISVSEKIANGNFDSRAYIKSKDEIGVLAVQFNKMAQSICDNLLKLKDTGSSLESYVTKLKITNSSITEISSDISTSSADLAASAEELNATIEEITSNALQVSQVVTEVFEATSETSGKSDKIVDITASGKNIIKDTINKINAISNAFEDIENKVKDLNKQSLEVRSFTDIIGNIASQTNLISLNAAIEAARAGEQGRGFAVVADEIRKLSEQSSKATAEINQLISHIDNGIKETVNSTERGRLEIKAGVELTMKAGDSFNRINESVNDTILLIKQIDEKSKKADEGVKNVAATCEEFADAVEHVAGASQRLSGLAVNLYSTAVQSDTM